MQKLNSSLKDKFLFWDLDNINLKDETINILKDKSEYKVYLLKNKKLSRKREEIYQKVKNKIHNDSTFIECGNVDDKIFEMVKEVSSAEHIIIVSNDKDFFKLASVSTNIEIMTLKPHKSEKNITITQF